MNWKTPIAEWVRVCVCAGCVSAVPARAEPVTLGTLLAEMTDPERLTRLPEAPYRLLHASSCDRLALQPNTPAWFANADSCNYLRTETANGRTEYVLLDADGPGAIVRFWTTAIWSDNTLRVYLDEAATPQIEGTLTQIVGNDALAAAPLSFISPFKTGTIMTGHNLYLPIPFGRHCKVTLSTPNNAYIYYNIDYRVYDAGAEVESFTTNALSVYQADYARALSALTEGHPSGLATSLCSRLEGRLTWGGDQRAITLRGASAIRRMKFKLAAPDLAQALRSTHLELDFDDERGAVHCPVGDFFGAGCTVTAGSTWFLEATSNGVLQAFWTMPFRDRAVVRLVNHGQQPVDILQGEVWTGPYDWADDSLHFHAAWRDYPFEDTVGNKGKDVNYVTLQGCGRLVGDTLSIFNDASSPQHWCNNWWGEGDEKIYVDGELFPSHFGTGSEDYYGYAWCSAQPFNTPFIAQPSGAGNDQRGNTINTRLRLLDDIPYRTGLRFDMELLTWQPGRYRYAPTVFWYARPGGACATPEPLANSQLPVPRATSGVEAAPALCPLGVHRDVATMAVLQNTGGAISCVTSNGLGLSGENVVRWQNCGAGSRVEFGFPASFDGQCALAVRVLRGPLSGAVRVSVNGQTAAGDVNLNTLLTEPALLRLGSHLLRCGVNTLTFEVTGMPAGNGQAEFAFDSLENEGPYYVSRASPVLRERMEAESLPAVATCGEVAAVSNACVGSGGACAVWSGAQAGGGAAFKIASEGARQVPLSVVFLCTTNGPICDISVNGQTACQGLDLYRAEAAFTNVLLGVQVLSPGTNDVKVTVVGCAQGLDASSLAVGLDCVDIGSLYALNMGKQTRTPLIGPHDDPDGDGLFNLAEYAFGGDPGQPDGAGLWPAPGVLREGGQVVPVIAYRRRKPASALPVLGAEGLDLQVDGLVYQVQEAVALGAEARWSTTNLLGPAVMSVGEPDDDNGETVRVRVRTVQPLPGGVPSSRYMRVGLREP